MSQPAINFDEAPFEESFVPERLVSREQEIKEIARCLNPARSGRSIRSIFIFGKPGSGKTVACKHVLKHFPKQSIYVNCWSNSTTHKVLQSLLIQQGQMIHGRESASDLAKRFQSLGRKLIVCLDESDHLKDRDVLYILARNSCGIILISNLPSQLSNMDPRIKSSLLLNEIEFKPYSREEILAILKERITYGMRSDAIDARQLALVANACRGDARVALQTLKIAAKEAESKGSDKITVAEIRSALKCSRKYRLSYLLTKLNTHQRIIYEILKSNKKMESGKLFSEYSKKMNGSVVDRTYRNHVQKMEELGLVRSEGSSRWKTYEVS